MTNLQIASLQVNRGSPRAAECLEWVVSRRSLAAVAAFADDQIGRQDAV
jgi:hypothetical protein